MEAQDHVESFAKHLAQPLVRQMNIALDYDGTFSADPGLWKNFIRDAKLRGHEVILITMRYEDPVESAEVIQALEESDVRIIYTNRKAKQKFVDELNLKIDIWIDDKPFWLYQDG